jgi:hypothetical protein
VPVIWLEVLGMVQSGKKHKVNPRKVSGAINFFIMLAIRMMIKVKNYL